MIEGTGQRLILFLALSSTILLASAKHLGAQSPSTAGAAGGASITGRLGLRGGDIPLPSLPAIDGLQELGAGIFRITDPRPMQGIAILLQRKFGVPVSYEEEVLQYSGDMISAADLPGNREALAKNPSWNAPLVPRLGVIELSIPPRDILKSIADPTIYIEQAIDSHQRNNNSGGFKVVNLGVYGLSIVMNKMADKSGKIITVQPALDTLVSFPEMDRSLGETLGLISKAVAAEGKIPFGVGGLGGNGGFFQRTHVKVGAQNEPARNVIAKALRIPGQELRSWALVTFPGGSTSLTVQTVGIEVTDSSGRVGLQTLTWPR